MRISPFTIIGVTALGVILAVGCSKNPNPPTVTFLGYKVGSDGTTRAVVEMRNRSRSPIVCQLEVQPRDPWTSSSAYFIQAKGSVTTPMYVSDTNALSLSVTVFRTDPVQHLTVPMQ
jgi:hypothetical protein